MKETPDERFLGIPYRSREQQQSYKTLLHLFYLAKASGYTTRASAALAVYGFRTLLRALSAAEAELDEIDPGSLTGSIAARLWADLAALNIRAVRHDPVPPQQIS